MSLALPLDGGGPRQIAQIPAGSLGITNADWNTAGDSLAMCLQSATFDVMLVQGFGGRGERPSLRVTGK